MSQVTVKDISVRAFPIENGKPVSSKMSCLACGYSKGFTAGGPRPSEPYGRYNCGKCGGRKLLYEVFTLTSGTAKTKPAKSTQKVSKSTPKVSKSTPTRGPEVKVRPWRKSVTPVRAKGKDCLKCGQPIAEHTFLVRPDTKYCSEHITKNDTYLPSQDTFGSREDYKRDSGANWSNARKPKL